MIDPITICLAFGYPLGMMIGGMIMTWGVSRECLEAQDLRGRRNLMTHSTMPCGCSWTMHAVDCEERRRY